MDYKLRGTCKEAAYEAVSKDPTLTLVRGHYDCPFWGKQQHWWTVRKDGTIFDPTSKQFPSGGLGEYIPFTGILNCDQCGKSVKEEEATFYGRYALCSHKCACKFVGIL